ncbi:MAG: hypothetical protein ACKVPX_02415 [Myxococcaceae bacterium]
MPERTVRVAFRYEKPWFKELLSDIALEANGSPKRVYRRYLASGMTRSALPLDALVREAECVPGYWRRAEEVKIRHGDQELVFRVPLADLGELDKLIVNRITALPNVTLEVRRPRARAILGLKTPVVPIATADRFAVTFERGIAKYWALYADRHVAPDGRSRMLIGGPSGPGPRTSELSLPEIVDEIRRLPGYSERGEPAVIHVDGETLVLHVGGSGGGSLLDTLAGDRAQSAHYVAIEKQVPAAGKLAVWRFLAQCGETRGHRWVRAEFRDRALVGTTALEPPLGLDEHPGLRPPWVVVDQLALGDEREERPSFEPVTEQLARTSNRVLASAAKLPLRASRVVLEVLPAATMPDLTPLDRLRLRLPALSGFEDWDRVAADYQTLLPNQATYLTTRVALNYLRTLAEEGRIAWPSRVLSVGSGTGDLTRALSELEGVPTPRVVESDFAENMLTLSTSSSRVLTDVGAWAFAAGVFQGVECSAPHRLGGEDALVKMLTGAARSLSMGGVLWMKAEGLYFDPSWTAGLQSLGFEMLPPFNAQLSIPSSIVQAVAPALRAKVRAALTNTRFLFAVKRREVSPADVTPADKFGFQRRPRLPDVLAEIAACVAHARSRPGDELIIQQGEQIARLLDSIPDDDYSDCATLLTSLTQRYLELCFHRAELVAPKPGNRSLLVHGPTMQAQVAAALQSLGPLPQNDVVVRYLRATQALLGQLQARSSGRPQK